MIIGIDLGTTNSLVSVWKNGEVRIIPNALGLHLTPSAVGLDDNNTVLVGQAAKERISTHPNNTAVNFKRYMGTDRQFPLGKKLFRAEELSSFVISALKRDAEDFLGEPVTEAVITVPAYFNDAQRKATKVAGELAGLKVERLLNEPTAAAMAYGLHSRDTESKYLVFDLGGGTFDISILEMFDGIMEVHASAGDNHLGGTDFTAALANHFITEKASDLGVKEESIPDELLQRIYIHAEKTKREISDKGRAEFKINWKSKEASLDIDELMFEALTEHLLKRISRPIRGAMRDAKVMVEDIHEIILVGGATRTSAVRKLATRLFHRFPATDINPDEVIVQGAAVQAGLKMRDAALDDMVLTDVCPYTLGIEVTVGSESNPIGGHFQPIIERNNYIPISRVERFYTLQDKQKQLKVKIFQGESPKVKDNVFLGDLNVNVPSAAAGEESIDVRFTYDINGLLEVLVTVVSTGHEHSVVIEENPGVLTEEEVKEKLKKLSALKIHPRDKTENLTLINRSDRLFRELLGEERTILSNAIAQFESVLEKQNERDISAAQKKMKEVLDHFDGSYQF